MSASRDILFFLVTIFVCNLVHSTEFVPCFMWSNKRTNEKVPALNKISQDIFKEEMQQHLQDNELVVIFAEQTLSPEDFAQQDQSGVIFSNLAKLSKTSKVSYLPYVQTPIKALKHLDATLTEVPLDKIGAGFELPESDILIVNLNDAREDENRIDMLKRHDAQIALIYQDLALTNKNILAILTAHHASWVASEDVVRSRQARSLLQADEPVAEPKNEEKPAEDVKSAKMSQPLVQIGKSFYNGSNVFIYVTNTSYTYEKTDYTINTISFTQDKVSDLVVLVNAGLVGANHTINMTLNLTTAEAGVGYWKLADRIPASIKNATLKQVDFNLTSSVQIVAPTTFSFHCGDQAFVNSDIMVTLRDFQVQLFTANAISNTTKFSDAYDCVGFTSVPIWSGLFVTIILLIIMTLGITMMMDIRTMDRFDDAKVDACKKIYNEETNSNIRVAVSDWLNQAKFRKPRKEKNNVLQ